MTGTPSGLRVLLLAALLLAACSPRSGTPAPGGGLVSLAPSLTETLFDLGVGDRVVAVTDGDSWPEAVRRLPTVGSVTPDFERIVALRPDLVVMDSALSSPELLQRLHALELEVLAVDTRSFEDLARNLATLGDRLGVPEAGTRLRKELEAALQDADRRAAALPRRPRVFVEVWNDPIMTAGGKTFLDEMIRRAGGQNVYGDLADPYPTISAEDLVLRAPDVVVLTTSRPADLAGRPGWAQLEAVQEGRLEFIDPDLLVRPTMRSLQGLKRLQDLFRRAVGE